MSRRLVNYGNLDAGLMQNVPGETVPTGFTPSCRNVELMANGRLRMPRRGFRRFSAVIDASKTVGGLWHLVRRDSTWAIVAACDGAFYRVKATGEVVSLGTGYDAGEWNGCVYWGKLFLGNPNQQPLIYDTALENLTDQDDVTLPETWEAGNWPADFSLIAGGGTERLAAWGFKKEPSRVYFSALQDYLDWTTSEDSFYLEPRKYDGERIVAVADFQDILFLMKQTNSVLYYGLDPTAGASLLEVTDRVKSIPFGCASQRSIVKIENDILWWSQEGPMSLSSVNDYGNVAGDIMRSRLAEVLKDVDPTRTHKIVGLYDGERVRWIYPRRSDTRNVGILDYYPKRAYKDALGVRQGAWFAGDGLEMASAIAMPMAKEVMTLFGDYDGYVNEVYGSTDNGTAIASEYHFPDIDTAGQADVLRADFLVSEGGASLVGSMQRDDGAFASLGGTLAPSFPGDAAPAVSRKVPYGAGRSFGFKVTRSSGSDRAILDGLIVEVDIKGVR